MKNLIATLLYVWVCTWTVMKFILAWMFIILCFIMMLYVAVFPILLAEVEESAGWLLLYLVYVVVLSLWVGFRK